MSGARRRVGNTGGMRHLHFSADDSHSLCGRGLSQVNSVHVTKARRGRDCAECRRLFRAGLKPRKTFRVVTSATEYREALVEAGSEEEARMLVEQGKVDTSFVCVDDFSVDDAEEVRS